MTNSQTIQHGGAVLFWSLARWHNRAPLLADLEAAGLEKFCPAKRGALQALRDALCENFPKHSVEYTLGKKFYQVDAIDREDDEVQYRKVLTASIDEHNAISISPWSYQIADNIKNSFNRYLGMVQGPALSDCLIRYVQHLGGTRLREAGGIYWLADDKHAEWKLMTDVVQRHGVKNDGSACYIIRHAMDSDAVRAIRDAIITEISASAAKLQEEIEGGELTERQLEHRKQSADLLRCKIKDYEFMLGQALTKLHDALDTALTAETGAAMLSSIAGMVGEEAVA